MTCIAIPPTNVDSEMEEGEIIDDVDELSDISSEEEFLLRQRLEVLENYNNVLERKQAKKTNTTCNGKKQRNKNIVLCDLSEVSETDLDDNYIHVSQKYLKKTTLVKPHRRKKQPKETVNIVKKNKEGKKKTKQTKKRSITKLYNKSSDSEDEYFNKKRRLADAVTLKRNKIDTSTLKDRITKMLFGSKTKTQSNIIQLKQTDTLPSNLEINRNVKSIQNKSDCVNQTKSQVNIENNVKHHSNNSDDTILQPENIKPDDTSVKPENVLEKPATTVLCESIDLCTNNENSQDIVDSSKIEKVVNSNDAINDHRTDASSDEDLEMLREYALKTKSSKLQNEVLPKNKTDNKESKQTVASDDEDSDTAELRLICLKSTLLKKAIEMKQKQKLRKRLSQSSCLPNDYSLQDEIINVPSENNTDIESVDMDIGSDGEEKTKENSNVIKCDSKVNNDISKDKNINQTDELEEDEDLLRAKLLTSLSKNLPNLVDLNIFESDEGNMHNTKKVKVPNLPVRIPEEKKIIINVGESDSEGEHEATKNLTKMHMKLAEHYEDFQLKLDHLLKSTRKEFEKDTLPDVVQRPVIQKPQQKFVPKAMNHLPKSEQIEYKNLVKRMAELEKIKQARNSLTAFQNKTPVKETLKPRNVSLNTLQLPNIMEEKIALSRKKIAEESAKILKLKEEAKKLTQKYKIVATELKNISTAINFNKKQQRVVHNNLQHIRLQHQLLLKGSNHNFHTRSLSNKTLLLNKVQKENNPKVKETTAYMNLLKSVKVSIVNDVNKDVSSVQSRLSVQLDVANNKKTIKVPKSPPKERVVNINRTELNDIPKTTEAEPDAIGSLVEKSEEQDIESYIVRDVPITSATKDHSIKTCVDNYKSPLEALGDTTWSEDPNGFLCPYEVGGSCRDPECKYLHPKIQSSQ